LEEHETGVDHYAIASDEDPSVEEVAERVHAMAQRAGYETSVELVDNPRSGETMVEQFGVDTSKAREELGWGPTRTIEDTIQKQLTD
jgi:nucleoside-diphosphate-sugar epimerase